MVSAPYDAERWPCACIGWRFRTLAGTAQDARMQGRRVRARRRAAVAPASAPAACRLPRRNRAGAQARSAPRAGLAKDRSHARRSLAGTSAVPARPGIAGARGRGRALGRGATAAGFRDVSPGSVPRATSRFAAGGARAAAPSGRHGGAAERPAGQPLRAQHRSRWAPGTEAAIRGDLAALPTLLAHADALLEEGTLALSPPNAATLQVLSSVRLLDTFADLHEYVSTHSCAQAARDVFPRYPASLPHFLPSEWLGAMIVRPS